MERAPSMNSTNPVEGQRETEECAVIRYNIPTIEETQQNRRRINKRTTGGNGRGVHT